MIPNLPNQANLVSLDVFCFVSVFIAHKGHSF